MLVKACGLRTAEEISWAHSLGYDLWGIVVEPKSKRYVCAQELELLWQTLPDSKSKGQNKGANCVLVARKWQYLAIYAQLYPQALLQCYESYPHFIPPERRFMPLSGEEQWFATPCPPKRSLLPLRCKLRFWRMAWLAELVSK